MNPLTEKLLKVPCPRCKVPAGTKCTPFSKNNPLSKDKGPHGCYERLSLADQVLGVRIPSMALIMKSENSRRSEWCHHCKAGHFDKCKGTRRANHGLVLECWHYNRRTAEKRAAKRLDAVTGSVVI